MHIKHTHLGLILLKKKSLLLKKNIYIYITFTAHSWRLSGKPDFYPENCQWERWLSFLFSFLSKLYFRVTKYMVLNNNRFATSIAIFKLTDHSSHQEDWDIQTLCASKCDVIWSTYHNLYKILPKEIEPRCKNYQFTGNPGYRGTSYMTQWKNNWINLEFRTTAFLVSST